MPAVAAAISTNPADYAIVGENGVSMNSYCTCLGDIYSRGDLNLQFGYGIQSGSNAGNMISTGNVNVGLESNVTGNIYANGGVSLNGDDTITGNVVYGTTYGTSLTGNLVTGTVTQAANSVPAVNLPTATGFTPGTTDINASSNLTLAPGSYGNVTESGLYQNVYLSSGDYYLKSFNMPSGGYLLNITNAPIRVFVQGNVDFGSYLTTYLNGQSSGTSSLASCVLFQAGGNFNLDGGSLYNFYGTVFTPDGSVSLSNDSMYGSIMSSGSVGRDLLDQDGVQLVELAHAVDGDDGGHYHRGRNGERRRVAHEHWDFRRQRDQLLSRGNRVLGKRGGARVVVAERNPGRPVVPSLFFVANFHDSRTQYRNDCGNRRQCVESRPKALRLRSRFSTTPTPPCPLLPTRQPRRSTSAMCCEGRTSPARVSPSTTGRRTRRQPTRRT